MLDLLHTRNDDEAGVRQGTRSSTAMVAGSHNKTPIEPNHYGGLSPSLSRLSPAQLISFADLVGPQIAPTAPATPPLPNLAAKATALEAKRDGAETAKDA